MDTLHIHNGVYTAYAPWRMCHAYVELHMQSNIAILAVYTQFQKKRTMNSMTSPVTQGSGEVSMARSNLIKRIWKMWQKTPFKNWIILEWGFLHFVINSTGKVKCTSKFIYLHSSQKETHLATVRFFWDWVYLGIDEGDGTEHHKMKNKIRK